MRKINDDLWIWAVLEGQSVLSLKENIDKKYSLPETPNTTLYHYTDASGFKGIINSRSLWLTDIDYMNDAGELRYAQNLIRNVIQDFRVQHNAHKMFFEKLDWLADPFENSFNIYITCFCEEGELLSQWKNYGLYSLGFNTIEEIRVNPSILRRVGNWYPATLRKVIYDKERQINTIKDIIDGIFKLYKKSLRLINISWKNENPEMIAQDYARVFANFIIPYVLCFKDEVFKEEKEWRLIHIQDNKSYENVNFRSKEEYLVPYIEGKLKTIDEEKFEEYHREMEENNRPMGVDDQEEYVEENGSFPIKEIIIGPDPHHEIAESSAEKYLSKKGFLDCNISSKSTNLRKGW